MSASELRKEITCELEFIHRITGELDAMAREFPAQAEPGLRNTMAASALLAQFYMGIENILKRLAVYEGHPLPDGAQWHSNLLSLFQQQSGNKPPLLESDLSTSINRFRGFRHVMHHTYGFFLDWNRLYAGVSSAAETLRNFEARIQTYLGW